VRAVRPSQLSEGDAVRALLSVADRSGLPDLARDLVARGVELVATDGTREALTAEGIEAGSVGD
jgi:phosphoribosylaminoimidazolecarboxamide formyltransferase/IMP cyclohydrolase